ncbi:hypothetical protein B9Z19DRAFT_1160063 [Tuber borchii]|uniref:Uncharacterized protein n=1 Tax=Tuber borchii TaxID=42251 RepID=A0A2T7A3C5_TUBBO|nr:hypothetical protein B9Z19DRAFT_1160063 [Tuber borchii]
MASITASSSSAQPSRGRKRTIEDDRDGNSRKRGGKEPPVGEGSKDGIYCPFWVSDPRNHKGSCASAKSDLSRLKEHLKKSHFLYLQCPFDGCKFCSGYENQVRRHHSFVHGRGSNGSPILQPRCEELQRKSKALESKDLTWDKINDICFSVGPEKPAGALGDPGGSENEEDDEDDEEDDEDDEEDDEDDEEDDEDDKEEPAVPSFPSEQSSLPPQSSSFKFPPEHSLYPREYSSFLPPLPSSAGPSQGYDFSQAPPPSRITSAHLGYPPPSTAGPSQGYDFSQAPPPSRITSAHLGYPPPSTAGPSQGYDFSQAPPPSRITSAHLGYPPTGTARPSQEYDILQAPAPSRITSSHLVPPPPSSAGPPPPAHITSSHFGHFLSSSAGPSQEFNLPPPPHAPPNPATVAPWELAERYITLNFKAFRQTCIKGLERRHGTLPRSHEEMNSVFRDIDLFFKQLERSAKSTLNPPS